MEQLKQTQQNISIHALREEGDKTQTQSTRRPTHFNPRPPRGGRPIGQFTMKCLIDISIHALREEGDRISASSF